MAKILHVDDDFELSARVSQWLARDGHLVEHAESGEDAMQLVSNFTFEILLLDWNLPGISGLDVCRRYRQAGGDGWIIFLTGMNDIANKEQALDYGADDYMVKPFDVRELSARVKSCLSKKVTRLSNELRVGKVIFIPASRELKINGENLRITSKEAALSEFLMRNTGKVFSTKQLLHSIWPSDSESSEGTIRTTMHNLRKKLEAAGVPEFIKTVLGSGYTIDEIEN